MNKNSIIIRSIIAIILTILFYLLALSIAFGAFYLVYQQLTYGRRIRKGTIMLGFAGVLILFSIIPKRLEFLEPGILLNESEHPLLFASIKRIANHLEQELPKEVYLIFEANAFVSEIGGFLGFGSKRVLAIGLPLLQSLSISEIEGVIAHEFGHYYGKDTKLSPLIYRTSVSIQNTLKNLGEAGSIIQLPFIGFGKLFFYITNSISRNQEYEADKVAAEIVGSNVYESALSKISRIGAEFNLFYNDAILTPIQKGYMIPLVESYEKFCKTEYVKNSVAEIIKSIPDVDEGTHPSTQKRVAAVKDLNNINNYNDESAISLLNNIHNYYEDIYRAEFDNLPIDLKLIDYPNLPIDVYISDWNSTIEVFNEYMSKYKLEDFPSLICDDHSKLFDDIRDFNYQLPPSVAFNAAADYVGSSLAILLINEKWEKIIELGNPIIFSKNGVEVKPLDLAYDIVNNKISKEKWLEIIKITDLQDKSI